MTKLQDMKPAERKKRIAALIKNPGTRAAVADKFLPPELRKQRALNTRLKAPVVEGSAVTMGDLARQRKSAAALKYGAPESQLAQQLAGSQQQQRDTAGWYEQYKQELAAHQANTAAIGAQEQAQMQQFGNAVTGLDQGQLNATTQASVADAATRGVVPGADAAVQMDQGSAVRQALVGSFGAMMAGQAGDANRYADTLSHVVAPGQALQGQAVAAGKTAKVRQSQQDLAKEKGSFEQQFEDEFKQNESKNVLAQKIATGKTAQEQQKIDIAAALAKSTVTDRTAKTQETAKARRSRERIATDRNAMSDSQFKTKYGLSKAQQQEKERHDRAMEAKAGKTKAGDPATVDAKDFYAKYKVKPATTVQLNSAKSNISTASTWVRQVLASNPKMPLSQVGQLLSTGQPKSKDSAAVPKLDSLFVRVAMDIKQFGGVTAGTADRLHKAGYSVAKLGLKPGKPKPKAAPYKPPASGPASKIPGVGGN